MVMRTERFFNTKGGLISGDLYKIPNRRFMPSIVFQTACEGKNLEFLGCNTNEIPAGSIGLSYEQSVIGTIGEFVERYSASIYDTNNLVWSNYNSLIKKNYNVLDPELIKPYSNKQYSNKKLNLTPITKDIKIDWIKGYDFLNKEDIYVPAPLIFLPYIYKNKSEYFIQNTSTGLSAGQDIENAFKGGLFECAERHAFCEFWYKQNSLKAIHYTKKLVLDEFKNNKILKELFDNNFVKLKVFDLSEFVPIETICVFLYFEYKRKLFQSCGAASRFSKEDALIKAALEAYQGIEYALSLQQKKFWENKKLDLSLVDSFDKHFDFYNSFPELRKKSSIINQALNSDNGDKQVYYRSKFVMCQNLLDNELKKLGLNHIIYVDITLPDVGELGYNVVKVVTPGWNLLTGSHSLPFLGGTLNNCNNKNLFLDYPHPFP